MDAVLRVIDPSTADNVNLKDIRVVQKLGYAGYYSIKANFSYTVIIIILSSLSVVFSSSGLHFHGFAGIINPLGMLRLQENSLQAFFMFSQHPA